MAFARERKGNACGRLIQRARADKGWSQEKLAVECQLNGFSASRDMIARIEIGTRTVIDLELITIAKALGLSAADLLP